MAKVTAPYNFVPLSEHVCRAADLHSGFAERPSQDVPFDGAISGEIQISLETHTPFLISGAQEETKAFLEDPVTNKPVIPGSSLRGMIRNVMEIASFGKLIFVDDRQHGVRDLAPTSRVDYGDRITEKRQGGYAPKTQAGWLQRRAGSLILTRCEFGRIEHHDLDKLAKGFGRKAKDLARERDQEKRQARQLQELFLHHGGKLDQALHVEDRETAHEHSRGKLLTYRKVTPGASGGATKQDGRLVFTGLPGSNKHMEFFFFDPRNEMAVEDDVWRKFIAVHEAQEKESKTWLWQRTALESGDKIPVFWLADEHGQLAQIGLAMMFKLAADNSTHDLIRKVSDDHLDQNLIDLPTRLFGHIDKESGFKTRVSFGYAKLENGTPSSFSREVVGAAPKPGFLPSSITQVDLADEDALIVVRPGDRPQFAQYRSYMDWKDRKGRVHSSKPRGWKRYPVRGDGAHEPPSVPNSVGPGARTTLNAIYDKNGLGFSGKVRFHNMHPVEVGALLWCLDFGGEQGLRHSLGMGKPYGWGQVSLKVGSVSGADADECRAAFIEAIETWAAQRSIKGGWAKSVQIMRLRAMADPKVGKDQIDLLKQMILNPDNNRNDFVEAKKAGSVLPEYRHPDEGAFAPPALAVADVKGAPQQADRGGNRQGGGGARHNNARRNVAPAPSGPYREGESVTWVEEGETVTVVSDEAGGMVEIEIDGEQVLVGRNELKR